MIWSPSSQDDLLGALGDLAETLQHIATAARHQTETRLDHPAMSAHELRMLSRLLRSPDTSIRSMAHPSFPTSAMIRAADALLRKGLAAATTAPPYDEDTTYVATAAAAEFRTAMRDYHTRCFRYALTAIPDPARSALEEAAPALGVLAAALGYRQVFEADEETSP